MEGSNGNEIKILCNWKDLDKEHQHTAVLNMVVLCTLAVSTFVHLSPTVPNWEKSGAFDPKRCHLASFL